MRDILHFENESGELFKMGEITRKYKAHDKENYGVLAQLRIYRPKTNPVDDSDGDLFFFKKSGDDYYLIPELGFASPEGNLFLFNVYHNMLIEKKPVSLGRFIATVYREYFYKAGKP